METEKFFTDRAEKTFEIFFHFLASHFHHKNSNSSTSSHQLPTPNRISCTSPIQLILFAFKPLLSSTSTVAMLAAKKSIYDNWINMHYGPRDQARVLSYPSTSTSHLTLFLQNVQMNATFPRLTHADTGFILSYMASYHVRQLPT